MKINSLTLRIFLLSFLISLTYSVKLGNMSQSYTQYQSPNQLKSQNDYNVPKYNPPTYNQVIPSIDSLKSNVLGSNSVISTNDSNDRIYNINHFSINSFIYLLYK